MAEGLGPSFEALLSGATEQLAALLYASMRDPAEEVRQSAFALVGDWAKVGQPASTQTLHTGVPSTTAPVPA